MKKYFRIAVLFIILLITNSCKEENLQVISEPDLITKAKLYFDSKAKVNPLKKGYSISSSKIMLEKKLFWEEAIVQELFGTQIVVVPVQVDKILAIQKDGGAMEKRAHQTLLILYKNLSDDWVVEFLVKIPDQDYLDRKNVKTKSFTGTVLVKDLNDNFLKGYAIKDNGKVYKVLSNSVNSATKKQISVKSTCTITDHFWCNTVSFEGSIGTHCVYEYTTMECTEAPPQETLEGQNYGSGGSGTASTIGTTFNPSLVPGGVGRKPLYIFPDKCAGLQYSWNNYPQNEVTGYITDNGSVIVTGILDFDGGKSQGLYEQDGKYYYVYPTSNGAPQHEVNSVISRDHYFIPIVAHFHTHTPCQNDGTNGVSHSVSDEDRDFAQRYPGLRNFAIGCNAIAQFDTGASFFNVQSGSLSSLCNNVY